MCLLTLLDCPSADPHSSFTTHTTAVKKESPEECPIPCGHELENLLAIRFFNGGEGDY